MKRYYLSTKHERSAVFYHRLKKVYVINKAVLKRLELQSAVSQQIIIKLMALQINIYNTKTEYFRPH